VEEGCSPSKVEEYIKWMRTGLAENLMVT
jgi:hypothetical protein